MARAKDRLKTEYIVWMRITRDGELVGEQNAMGTGYRFATKREARFEADRISRRETPHVADEGMELEVYIVPTPRGAMQRNEALWERVEVPA